MLIVAAGVAAWTGWHADRRARVASATRSTGVLVAAWQVGVVEVAGVVATAVWSSSPDSRATGPLTLVFPLTTSAGVAVVATWAWQRLAPVLPRWPTRQGSPGWLARRRRSVGALVPVTLALTVGLSVVGYGMTVRRGVEESVADKAVALAGAATTADLGQQLQGLGFREVTQMVGDGSTVVYQRSVTLPPSFGDRPMLVVDPAAFAEVADWGATLQEARSSMDALASSTTTTTDVVPVVLVGRTPLRPGDSMSLGVTPEPLVAAQVVAVVDAFPGTAGLSPDVTVVTSRKGLFRLLSTGVDPRTPPEKTFGGEFTAVVWSTRSAREVRATLEGAGLVGDHVQRLADARSRPELLASAWAVGYLRPLELGAGLLVAAAVVLLVRRLLERDAVTDLVLRRMGWSRRELLSSRAREVLSVLAVSGAAAAASIALLLLAPTTIESVPRLPPVTAPHLTVGDLAWWAGACVSLLLLAAAVLAVGHRRPAAEVLRGNR
jgi:hypothetical protein